MAPGNTPSNGPDGADPRAARRARRRDRSREEILEAARAVLLRSGLAAMTLDAVATEAGMSKAGLYYYFASKDALVFELVYGVFERMARRVDSGVRRSEDGAGALRAIVRETVGVFGPRIDDFRLVFMLGQVAGDGGLRWSPEQFARIRPLNDLCYGAAAGRLREEGLAPVEPRLMAFLAHLAAIGLLTMKGLVEQQDDPLVFSDAELVEAFGRVFEAALSR